MALALRSPVPFADFKVEAEIDLDRKDSFEVTGQFKLGAVSERIEPLTGDVTLQLGNFSTTIMASCFQENGRRIEFEGTIDGVKLDVAILHAGDDRYFFTASGEGTDLKGIVNPVTVTLTIGDNEGSKTVKAGIDH